MIRSLRMRLAVGITVVCVSILGLLGAAIFHGAFELEKELVFALLTEELDVLEQHYRAHEDYRPTQGPSVERYITPTGAEHMLPAHLRDLAPGQHELEIQGEERHIGVRLVDGARLTVVYDISAYEHREEHYMQHLGILLFLAAASTVLLSYLLSGFINRQLSDLARQVKEMPWDQPQAPLARHGQDEEIAVLAKALDDYRTRALEMMVREQAFTANASHELRTPLTAITTSTELLLLDPKLSDDARRRVLQVDRAARRMRYQIEALMVLSRGETITEQEPVDLRECAEEARSQVERYTVPRGVAYEVTIPRGTVILANRAALELVIGNLVRNAARFTERGFIRASYDGRRLAITDTGTGIPADLLPRIFERGARGDVSADGMGVGLDIVRNVCEMAGWTIDVRNLPEGGVTFEIGLGPALPRPARGEDDGVDESNSGPRFADEVQR